MRERESERESESERVKVRERECSRRDALSATHETRARRGFTIDFTFY